MPATFNDVQALMRAARWGHLATTDGTTVGVRPMGAWAWFDGELWCSSADPSDKVVQLRAVANAEYSFIRADAAHLRINGDIRVSQDLADKRRLYAAVPSLADHVQGPDDPHFAVLRLRPRRIRLMPRPDLPYEEVPLPPLDSSSKG